MAGRLRLRPALRRYAHSVQRRATPGFAGPYDAIPDIVAAYGMRRLLSAYEGPILRLRRDSDQAEQDFGYTDNGDLDVAAIAAWLSGANGLITTWYDQSGNGKHATQTTAASQPLYVASGQNSRPVARFDGADAFVVPGFGATGSVLAVANLSAGDAQQTVAGGSSPTNAFLPIAEAGSSNAEIYRMVGAPNFYVNGALTTPATRGQMHAAITGAAKLLAWINADLRFVSRLLYSLSVPAYGATGDLAELVIANAAWDATARQAAEAAANNYWGVF